MKINFFFYILNLLMVVLFAAGGYQLAKRLNRKRVYPLLIFAVFMQYVSSILNNFPEVSFNWMPWKYMIFFSYWGFFFSTAFFAMCIPHIEKRDRKAMWAIVGVMFILTGYINYSKFFFPIDEKIRELELKDGVCRQSTEYTCAACSAVTMLHYYGIESSEKEMMHYGLTDDKGTYFHSIAYGLKRRIGDEPYRVRLDLVTMEELAELPKPVMVSFILNTGLKPKKGFVKLIPDTFFDTSINHMVALFDVNEEWVHLGDPIYGRTKKKRKEFEDTWSECAIWIEKVD